MCFQQLINHALNQGTNTGTRGRQIQIQECLYKSSLELGDAVFFGFKVGERFLKSVWNETEINPRAQNCQFRVFFSHEK